MKPEPVPNEPALLLSGKKKTLVVADLHIGLEAELRESGINIPSQTRKMASHLQALCRNHDVDDVVIAGDVKHNVPMTSRQEYFEIPRILEELKKYVASVHIVQGNHDGNLRKFLPEWVKLHGTRGFVHRGCGFFHGHTWPSKEVMACRYIVMAHEHPTVQFIETLGERDSRRCWVRAKSIGKAVEERYPKSDPELIILPTFNGLLGGIAMNSEKKLLGPIMTNNLFDMDNSEIYLLNGTFLGKLKDLRL